jgi:hypothetical protein
MLQRILDLTPPWTTLPAPLPATSVGWFSCKTYIPARVSSVGPKFTWYPDVQKPSQEFSPQNLQPKQSPALSEHAALSKWYSQFLGPRMPSRPRLESALENLGEGDVARLESFKHAAWLTRSAQPRKPDSHLVYTVSEAHATEIRLFTTRTGRLGLTSCDIEESDKIIRFYGSDVALVVPKLPPSTYPAVEQRVKGRALIVASDKTGRNPDFLASYNAKFRWAVPSSLDDVDRWFNDCDSWSDIIEGKYGKPRLDMVAPDHSLQPEVERFDEMRVETYETTLTSN